MRQMPLIRPAYLDRFRCIGSSCEDDCCHDWDVHVDKANFEKLQNTPPGPLRVLIDANVQRMAQGACAQGSDARGTSPFAAIRLLPDGRCPFLSEEKLCRIQLEHGPSLLSHTCSTFPRTSNTIDGLQDETLSLSCPEAARLVLLDPGIFPPETRSERWCNWDETIPAADLRFYFWAMRELAIGIARNRNYPVWQRIFLLGAFARRLDAIAKSGLKQQVPALLRDFAAAVKTRSLCAAMETIPADLALQLDLVLQLVHLRVNRIGSKPGAALNPRLLESLREFAQGIGMDEGAGIANCASAYAEAYERHYAPFFRRHSHILENYLINAIFRETFPFGKTFFSKEARPEFGKTFTLLAVQFALVKGLLIGVAGFQKDRFNPDHVVRTVQTAIRYFEHSPEFLEKALALLASREMDNARGLTMLVRN